MLNEIYTQTYYLKLQSYLLKKLGSDNFKNKRQEYQALDKFLNTPGVAHIEKSILPQDPSEEKIYLSLVEALNERFIHLQQILINTPKYADYLNSYLDEDNFQNKSQEHAALTKFLNTPLLYLSKEILPQNAYQEEVFQNFAQEIKSRVKTIEDKNYKIALNNYFNTWFGEDKFFDIKEEHKALTKFLNTHKKYLDQEIIPKNEYQEEVFNDFRYNISCRVQNIETQIYEKTLKDYVNKELGRNKFSNIEQELQAINKFLNTPQYHFPNEILPKNEAQQKVYFGLAGHLNDRVAQIEKDLAGQANKSSSKERYHPRQGSNGVTGDERRFNYTNMEQESQHSWFSDNTKARKPSVDIKSVKTNLQMKFPKIPENKR